MRARALIGLGAVWFVAVGLGAAGPGPASSGIVLSARKMSSLKKEIRERDAGTASKSPTSREWVRTYTLEAHLANSTPDRRELKLRVYHFRKMAASRMKPDGELRVADRAELPCVLERNGGSETLRINATMNTEGDFAGYIVQAWETNRLVAVEASVQGLEELGRDEAKLAAVRRDLRVQRAEKK